MFSVEYRDRVREHVLALAEADSRVVAGAAVGSLAAEGDRWSDLDLTFGVPDGTAVEDVLEDWTRVSVLLRESGAVPELAAQVEPMLRELSSGELPS